MTRVILHGGYSGTWDGAGEDRALFQLLIDAAMQTNQRVMISVLAYETVADFPCLKETYATFQEMNPNVQLVIAGRDNFKQLLPQHRVVFLQGGHSREHHNALKDVTRNDLMHNKVLLAGSSSGGMMLCQWGYSRSGNGPLQGKGIVDLAFMPHADVWPVEDFLPKLRDVTKTSVLMLNENQMLELNVDSE